MTDERLILGIDGGGSKTVARLAVIDTPGGEPRCIGEGRSGPSNVLAVGWEQARRNLDEAVDQACRPLQTRAPAEVAAACAGLAGSDRDEVRSRVAGWARQRHLAQHFHMTHDGSLLLAAGSPAQTGVALISGTGSFAFGRSSDGMTARCGGWGALLGDEGSGCALGLAGLRAVTRAVDGRGPQTLLEDTLLEFLHLDDAWRLARLSTSADFPPHRAAELAPLVIRAAERGDAPADEIVRSTTQSLTHLVTTLVARLGLPPEGFTLALGGGVLVGSETFRQRLQQAIEARGLLPRTILVAHPVEGALRIAAAGPPVAHREEAERAGFEPAEQGIPHSPD